MKNFRRDDRAGRSRSSRGFGSDHGGGGMHQATCSQCGQPCQVPFKPSGGKPVYCDNCFGSRRGQDRRPSRRDFGGGREFGRVSMHQAICDQCGKSCEVPFAPTSGKPVYCGDCFGGKKDQGRGQGSRRDNQGEKFQEALSSINIKLDKILKALERKADQSLAIEEEKADIETPDEIADREEGEVKVEKPRKKSESKKKLIAEKTLAKKPAGKKKK